MYSTTEYFSSFTYFPLIVVYFVLSGVLSADLKSFDDTVLFKLNWPGKDATDLLDVPNSESMIVMSSSKEKYKCTIPIPQDKSKESEEVYDGPNALDILQGLFTQSSCTYRLESYWTYEVCHGRYVRQYHEDREVSKTKTQEFFLGRWNKEAQEKLGKELDSGLHYPPPVKKLDGLSLPYLQVNLTDGTMCDLNGKPRRTNVLYVCYALGKHEVYSFKETSTCEYELIVLSSLLCQHPKYKAGKLVSLVSASEEPPLPPLPDIEGRRRGGAETADALSPSKEPSFHSPPQSVLTYNESRPQDTGEHAINCLPVDGGPRKPKNLRKIEAESIKLRHQRFLEDERLKKMFSIYSIDKIEKDGESRVRLELRAVVDEDSLSTSPGSPPLPPFPSPPILTDTSPVESFLSGKNCLQGGSGWWKFEFCYGRWVDQFHVEGDGSRTVLRLGEFDRDAHIAWLNKNPHKKPRPSADRKQVSHFYGGGGTCDKTGLPRETEVKLKCVESSSPGAVSLYLIEPHTCQYILGVESPMVCQILGSLDQYGLSEPSVTADADDVAVASVDDSEDDAHKHDDL